MRAAGTGQVGAVCRPVLKVRVVRAVPHLSPDVDSSVLGAPPPFGGGVPVRVAATTTDTNGLSI